MKIRVILAALVMSVSVAFMGCQTTSTTQGQQMAIAGDTTFTVAVPEGVSVSAVKNAILLSLAKREWNIVSQEDNTVVAELNHRNVHAHIVITYDESVITIKDDSTDEYGAPYVPVRWINNLKKDFAQNMYSMNAMGY